MAEDQRELQLLPTPSSSRLSGETSNSSTNDHPMTRDAFESPPLDLHLSISFRSVQPASDCTVLDRLEKPHGCEDMQTEGSCIQALNQCTAEKFRPAAVDKAHAEKIKMRELTHKELELAESEFARARHMWNRAREEIGYAERIKENVTRRVDSMCMELTCQSCQQRFRP